MSAPVKERFPPLGMSPAVWGPIFWTTMHIVSLGYPAKPSEEDKAGAIAFYNSLAQVIPCPICKTHYKSFLTKSPVEAAVESRHDLIHWVFDIHNDVNEQLGKRRISFQEYVKYMQALAAAPNTKLPSSSSGPDVKTVALTVAAVALVAGVGYYYKQK
jgi:hypothetical protein